MGVPYGRLVLNMSKQTIPPRQVWALVSIGDEGTNSFTPTKKGNFYWSSLIDGWVGAWMIELTSPVGCSCD